MKVKLLKKARYKFQIEHKYTLTGILWRVVEWDGEGRRLVYNEWHPYHQLLVKVRRRMILTYCRTTFNHSKKTNVLHNIGSKHRHSRSVM